MANETHIINIDGMTCDGCVKSVHNAVESLDGVQTVSVELANNLATVSFDSTKISAQDIANEIEEAGFDATVANN